MSNQIKASIILVLLAGLLFTDGGTVRAADKSPGKSSLRILGLAIGNCRSLDIYSKLGPGMAIRDFPPPPMSPGCVMSPTGTTPWFYLLWKIPAARASG